MPAGLPLFARRAYGGRRRAGPLAPLRLDLVRNGRVLAQVLLRSLAALADPLLAVVDPRAGLVEDSGGHAHVEQSTLARDAFGGEDLELGDAERRRHLVLHDLHADAAAHDLGAVLDRFDRTDVQADRRVELQRLGARGRLGIAKDNADLLAKLVDETNGRIRL